MRIAITGAGGQLGSEFVLQFRMAGYVVFPFTHQILDISDFDAVQRTLKPLNLDILINCAAFTDVDSAETNVAFAFHSNADGPKNLASLCKKEGIRFIHISTDSVFSSVMPHYFHTDEKAKPLNVYSKSKFAGEQAVLTTYPDGSWIVRTAWTYGGFGGKFVRSIIKKAEGNGLLDVVDDQYGQPTTTKALAKYIELLMKTEVNPGIFHFASTDYVSRFKFARCIFELLDQDLDRIQPIQTQNIVGVAQRPKYSLLHVDNHLGKQLVELDNWRGYLTSFLKEASW